MNNKVCTHMHARAHTLKATQGKKTEIIALFALYTYRGCACVWPRHRERAGSEGDVLCSLL